MKNEQSNLGRQLNQDRGDWGQGAYVREMPKEDTIHFKDFSGGAFYSDAPEDTPANASSDTADMEVSKRDRLIKAPGTVLLEILEPKQPKQMALHASLDFRSELVLFDPPYLGVKADTTTNWLSTTMPATSDLPYFWTTYGETFAFANGFGVVRAREFGSTVVTDYPGIPNGASFAVFAGRFIVGGAVIDGVRQPLAYAFSGVDGFDAFDYDVDEGSGFEYLINDQAVGDGIIALRPMGLDILAFLCRKSVWIGRRTGDLDRPIDVTPRVTGKGCVSEQTARTVYGGVLYLSDEGVELFDGNDSKHVSGAIDWDFLPIDQDNLHLYKASYNPNSERYYLFCPDKTYVLDILQGRWYKRTLIALGGSPFALQEGGTPWSEVLTSWSDNAGKSWSSFGGSEAGAPMMTFLGVDSDFNYCLHQEDYVSYKHFGNDFLPFWTTPVAEDTRNILVVTTKRLRVRYANGGKTNFWLPNMDTSWTKVTAEPFEMPFSTKPFLRQSQNMFTGVGMGVRVEFTEGTPEISGIEMDFLRRGPRVDNGYPFTPREYQAEF